MYNPKPRPQTLLKEQETRIMVAFIEHLDEFKLALKQLDEARVEAEEAEASARIATKEADIKAHDVAIMLNKALAKQTEADETMKMANKLLMEAQALSASTSDKEINLAKLTLAMEKSAIDLKEKEQAMLFRLNDLIAKEEVFIKRERALEATLNAFKKV